MNRIILKIPALFAIAFLISLLIQCRKDTALVTDSSAKIEFSTDTIIFDTVFATIGSVTANLRVYNKNDKRIKISEISLSGGSSSAYEINIDGEPATSINDFEIDSGDSIFIFIRVNVNPNNVNSPFIIEDSLVFLTNGNYQAVKLIAWGQNANYIVADSYISGLPPFKIVAHENETVIWNNTLPYVVYGFAVVDSTGILRIEEGTQIHFHNQSGLWIYKGGCLKVNGTLQNPVVFQGDKLGFENDETPGQWDRIWINEGSVDNEIDHAIIKNAFIGIQAETLQEFMNNQLKLSNTIIKNMTGAGIFTRFYVINAHNSIIANCGQYTLALTTGGSYNFTHCTSANYWNNSFRPEPSLALSNYVLDTNDNPVVYPFLADFGNSIFTGNMKDEFTFDFEEGTELEWKFDHCLLKTSYVLTDTNHYNVCLQNKDPLFRDIALNDYHLDTIVSPVIGQGSQALGALYPIDLDGKARGTSPDLGAYQFIPDNGANGNPKHSGKSQIAKQLKNSTFRNKTRLKPQFNKKIVVQSFL